MNPSVEIAITNLEMIASIIQAHSETVARMASRTVDESERLDLWYIAETLKDSSVDVRRQVTTIFTAQQHHQQKA